MSSVLQVFYIRLFVWSNLDVVGDVRAAVVDFMGISSGIQSFLEELWKNGQKHGKEKLELGIGNWELGTGNWEAVGTGIKRVGCCDIKAQVEVGSGFRAIGQYRGQRSEYQVQ